MSAATLTSEAKAQLAATVRRLRERLLRDLHDEAERRYRLSIRKANAAGLDEAHRRRRERLEAWIDERVRACRPKTAKEKEEAEKRLLGQAIKEAAATLLNRLVLLRQIEAFDPHRPAVVKGGWNSSAYRQLQGHAPGLLGDETEGYAALLQVAFDELAVDLPGLFGEVGLTRLFPIPPATLRDVVRELDADELASAWTDDTTLGWVYQYWNDPEREALDAKINEGGKIEPHEIAAKTQMFTERYMVEWLLQNSLGLTWLCICKKNGWTPEAERVLPVLDERRAEWRKRREAGEVALDALMPIEGELEDAWKYYVPQRIPPDAIEKARSSIREVKLLDPACGSGHFLVVAFGLLARLYEEEARHRGETWTREQIARWILEDNLHGIDIDTRAVQIAAAALFLKARTYEPALRLGRMNLVAPALDLGRLPGDDPALVHFREELSRDRGIPPDATDLILSALSTVDHLGTLLKVDVEVEEAIARAQQVRDSHRQQQLLPADTQNIRIDSVASYGQVLANVEQFLTKHSAPDDLGLRLDGDQLAQGVRFLSLAKEASYDLVVGNPPYQGTGKTAFSDYLAVRYSRAKADLYAAFLDRGLELTRNSGLLALVTMRGWMFLGQFTDLRKHVLENAHLLAIADLGTGAFSSRSMDDVISTALVIVRNDGVGESSVGIQAAPLADPRRDAGKPARCQGELQVHSRRFDFEPSAFEVIDGLPIVYWWTKSFLSRYAAAPKLGRVAPARKGLCTGDDTRFMRLSWEVHRSSIFLRAIGDAEDGRLPAAYRWHPSVYGGKGAEWCHPLRTVVPWSSNGLELKLFAETSKGVRVQNEQFYFRPGVAFSAIGARFSARVHRYASVFGDKGPSVFPAECAAIVCALNREETRQVLQSLNPTISFQPGDVNRVPLFGMDSADVIFARVNEAFSEYERSSERSVEFRRPGTTTWQSVRVWAQKAIDRAEGAPLPDCILRHDSPGAISLVSFAVGVALGRFGGNGEGLVDDAPLSALPSGIFLLSADQGGGLSHSALRFLHEVWNEYGVVVGDGSDLCTYLRKSFFDYHRRLYENRPIYFPLSSAKKSYVAFISIHRWMDDTLQVLLADHLLPEKRRLEGELEDIRKARTEATGRGRAERRFAEIQKLLEELTAFVDQVTEIAERGPPPPDDRTPKRESDARFVMDLDDGVMVNSAALWPLLEPQWKDPKKWWKELATAQGRKDYDWSHLAARYFPPRVRGKCLDDSSLAVAHRCLWELHPAKAYAWELRLQDEIRPDFTIDEPGSDQARVRFLAEHPEQAKEILAVERIRRERKAAKAASRSAGEGSDGEVDGSADGPQQALPLDEEEADSADA